MFKKSMFDGGGGGGGGRREKGYRISCQHPPMIPWITTKAGFEPRVCGSRVGRSTKWATPVTPSPNTFKPTDKGR